jgi:hypothetical protein
MMKKSHGRVTDEQVERLGKIAGPMGEELDRLFARTLGQTYISSKRKQLTSTWVPHIGPDKIPGLFQDISTIIQDLL